MQRLYMHSPVKTYDTKIVMMKSMIFYLLFLKFLSRELILVYIYEHKPLVITANVTASWP